MPNIRFEIIAVAQSLERDLLLARPMLFPEVVCLGDNRRRLRAQVQRAVREILEQTPAGELYRRRIPAAVRIESLPFPVKTRQRSAAWREAAELRFDIVHWRHGDEAAIAYVPRARD